MVLHAAWFRCASALALVVLGAVLAGCAIQGGASLTPPDPGAGEGPRSGSRGNAVKVALLLPLTATGHTAAVAKAMKQAGELALFEIDNPAFQLIVKDDKSTPEGARAAAEEAISEGAELILGPLFAGSVQAIAPLARQARVPVLAFSNDRQVAGDGVYLLGFLPQQEVGRVVTYAIAQGHRRFAALLPEDAYGKVVEPAFRNAVTQGGGVIAALETYPPASNGMVEPAERIVAAITQAEEAQHPIDVLFVPGGPEILPSLGPLLAYAGIDSQRIRLLGTGGWDYPNIGREDAFLGGWYASADPRGWRQFSERFAKTFGSSPPRLASMAYDAVSIAIKLSSQPAGARFTAANLTRPTGFSGIDGPLRLLESGIAERGLAVLQVQSIGAKVVDAPSGFGGSMLSSPASRVN
ncbi:MAG: penicillin-binding protein activator [Hyphomicrobiaceae bacterium]|nr:penicillin-binding protein activator [Hyphomicrobiaceae bacterium]